MSDDRARRAHAILTAALDAPREERHAMVSRACEGDAELEALVRKLLAASDRSTGFLEFPALFSRERAGAAVPEAVGSYLVIGVLGAGGMATVYEAVQENPHRSVALKVMHQSMTSTDAFLRFRLETETLARLRHPGIAQIYEAGTAQLGLPAPSPFFAMELVPDALPITDYAREKGLSLRERLTMFASVCDAVVYGHQNGVIHRDIKPGNVLVGADGRPKVIDFGIARTTHAGSGGTPDLTTNGAGGSLLGTLNSMSPEQCISPESVDARSDVYSLGVLLYELVTGRLPFDLSKVSTPEAVRIIVDEPAPDASRVCPEAKGDLAAIIAKSLEKDRDKRYDGAAALAADVRRWFAFLPVEARPATVLDSAWKLARRNPPLAAAIGVAALALAAGTVVATISAVVATRARDHALDRERELEAVTLFQESLLRDVNVSEMGDHLRESLLSRVAHAATTTASTGEAEREAETARRELARLIERVNFTSIAVGSLNESVLARYARSIDSQFSEQPRLRARLLQQLADTMNTLGLYNEAEPIIRRALVLRRTTLGEDHADTLQSLFSLGSLLNTLGRSDEAIAMLEEAHARRVAAFGADHQLTLRVGTSLGGAYRRQGNLDEAHRVWSETLQAQRRVLGDHHEDTLRTLNNLGIVYALQDKPEEAEACWRELLSVRGRALSEEHPVFRSARGNLGMLLQDQGKLDQAKSFLEQSLADDRRKSGDAHVNTLVSMVQYALLLRQMGDLAGAEALFRECHAGRVATLGPEHPDTLRVLAALGTLLAERGDTTGGIDCLTRALEAQRRVLGDDHADTIESTHRLRVVRESAASTGERAHPPG